MSKLNLYITNASNTFSDKEVDIIQNAVHSAEKFISTHFDFDYDVDIIVTAPSFLMSTISEDGIGGRTYNSRLIILVVDTKEQPISENVVFETVCHEMSHSLRWEKLPEYSKTLFDTMIFEGLATVLEEQAINERQLDQKQFFLAQMQTTPQEVIDNIIDHLKDEMKSEHYDYETIFFTGNNDLPRWSGYRLGYYYIKKYLQENNSTIFDATLKSYSEFDPKI